MDSLTLDYQNSCQISETELKDLQNKLLPEIGQIAAARATGYTHQYASINLPFDNELLKTILATVKEKKSLQPRVLVVIGIGGSNLGTIAVLESLRGKFYNQDQNIKIYFVDTVDTDHVHDIGQLVERELATGNNIILNVISKSGTTTETIANFEVFLEILKNHRPYNYHQFVAAITDENSDLWHLAKQEEFTLLTIPKHVGGRYSVFSAVSLFPLCFLDIDCKQLLEGAQSGFAIGTQKTIEINCAALSASIIATHYNRDIVIHDTFLFSVACESLGLWYRQLSAESLGKTYNIKDERVNTGMLPTVSIGSTDLHSVAQLYLAGPYNRFTTFISVANNASHIIVPDYEEFEPLVANIQKKPLPSIMNAILEGTRKAYLNDNRPFVCWTLPEKSAFYMGQFMQLKMLEVMYLGFLLDVNPFDQPEVEKYKKETRDILAKK